MASRGLPRADAFVEGGNGGGGSAGGGGGAGDAFMVSAAQAALEAWGDCSPHSYVLDAAVLPALLPVIAARIPNRSPGNRAADLGHMFAAKGPNDPPLFLQLVKAQGGKVHFLHFWKAFSEAARLAGSQDGMPLTSELETLRAGSFGAWRRRAAAPLLAPQVTCF